MVPEIPIPGQQFPLFDFLDYAPVFLPATSEVGGGSLSTLSGTTESIVNALDLLYCGRELELRGKECREFYHGADRYIWRALTKAGSSERFRLLSWRMYQDTHPGGKEVVTFGGMIDDVIAKAVDQRLIIKRYTRGDAADSEKMLRLGELYESLYYTPAESPAPLTEICAYTDEFMLSIRRGENISYEFLPGLAPDADEQTRIYIDIQHATDSLSEAVQRYPWLLAHARDEPYDIAELRSDTVLSNFMRGKRRKEYLRAAERSRDRIVSMLSGEWVPQTDPQGTNILLDHGRLRFIDLEGAISRRISKSHRDAHIWMEPGISCDGSLILPLAERLDRLTDPYGAYHYLKQRIAGALAHGHSVPWHDWIPTARKRLNGFCSLLQGLAFELRDEIDAAGILCTELDPDKIAGSIQVVAEEDRPIDARQVLRP